jgi:hypothetical protein
VGGFDRGDYDPAYSNNGQFIAWSSYTEASFTNKIEKPMTELSEKNSFVLEQNAPNPFASETKINFRIVETSHVVMDVYNIAGQRVKTLVNGEYRPGYYSIGWNGKDENNKMLTSGLYLCQLRSGNNVQVKKMNLIR